MASSTTFTAVSFQLVSATQTALSVARVSFSQSPLVDSSSNSALNASNYTITGPASNFIQSIAVVPSDTFAVDITFEAPLAQGIWTIQASNIKDTDGASLQTPAIVSFNTTFSIPVNTVLPTVTTSTTTREYLRGLISPVIGGDNTDALLSALATGDDNVSDLAEAVFDQLFLSSASGSYLSQKAADYGISRPTDVTFDDDTFRALAISINNDKLTISAFLQALESFYGKSAVRAYAETSAYEPFTLYDGYDLTLSIDGETIPITFSASNFDSINNARAIEVALAITQAIHDAGFQGFATAYTDPEGGYKRVRIYSGARGLDSTVTVLGGKAQSILQFPTSLNPYGTFSAISWNVTVDSLNGYATFTTSSAVIDLTQVLEGDYVNIDSTAFSPGNRGSFGITGCSVVYDGAGQVTQSFTVVNPGAVAQSGVSQSAVGDLKFFRPDKQTTFDRTLHVIVAQSTDDSVDVVLPAIPDISAGVGAALLNNDSSVSGTGPYLYDSIQGIPVTGTTTALNQNLNSGLHYNSVLVNDASKFPSEGYLAIAFGYDNAVYSLQYTKLSNAELQLDAGFTFEKAIDSGAEVMYLPNRSTVDPGTLEGCCYLASPETARVVAQDTINSIAGAGLDVDITITYPSDRGLGNEGQTGTKHSDNSYVWGG